MVPEGLFSTYIYVFSGVNKKQKKRKFKCRKGMIICVTQVSLYHTAKTICVEILLIQLQSPVVSVGNTIRIQMFHNESARSKRINQLKILTAEHLKDTT